MIIYVVIISLSLIIITFFLTRGNSSPYQGTLAERFRPLTHIEIKQRKPFIYHLNSKWTYECRLDLTKNLVSLWNAKDAVLKAFNEKKYSVEIALLLLRELMYEIGQKPRGFLKRMQYKMVYHKSFEDNVGDFIELFNSMLMYQTRLFFLLNQLNQMMFVQQEEYTVMDGEVSSQERMRGPKHISNIFLNANTKKREQDTKQTEENQSSQQSRAAWVNMV